MSYTEKEVMDLRWKENEIPEHATLEDRKAMLECTPEEWNEIIDTYLETGLSWFPIARAMIIKRQEYLEEILA